MAVDLLLGLQMGEMKKREIVDVLTKKLFDL